MGKKYLIECRCCGNYSEASTGFFARKLINCVCGHVIDTRVEKYTSITCGTCGNTLVYDQSKGDDVTCPVCKKNVIEPDMRMKLIQIECPHCLSPMTVNKTHRYVDCPLCEESFNLQDYLAKKEVKDRGQGSLIQYSGDASTFIYKHVIEDFNAGSVIVVHEGQYAVLFNDRLAGMQFGAKVPRMLFGALNAAMSLASKSDTQVTKCTQKT